MKASIARYYSLVRIAYGLAAITMQVRLLACLPSKKHRRSLVNGVTFTGVLLTLLSFFFWPLALLGWACDGLDGKLARTLLVESHEGAMLDLIADISCATFLLACLVPFAAPLPLLCALCLRVRLTKGGRLMRVTLRSFAVLAFCLYQGYQGLS